jgi:hypothetical protein
MSDHPNDVAPHAERTDRMNRDNQERAAATSTRNPARSSAVNVCKIDATRSISFSTPFEVFEEHVDLPRGVAESAAMHARLVTASSLVHFNRRP